MPETMTRNRTPKLPNGLPSEPAVMEPERILELGNGLELWKVHPSTLREQDVNARSMPKAMFERLAQTIARDKRLESLPLCRCRRAAKAQREGLSGRWVERRAAERFSCVS